MSVHQINNYVRKSLYPFQPKPKYSYTNKIKYKNASCYSSLFFGTLKIMDVVTYGKKRKISYDEYKEGHGYAPPGMLPCQPSSQVQYYFNQYAKDAV